eukprot:COSAG01_NODE_72260_length_253_cov_1.012987_1_plen_44_part_10
MYDCTGYAALYEYRTVVRYVKLYSCTTVNSVSKLVCMWLYLARY